MPKHRNDRAASAVRTGWAWLRYVGAIAPALLAACSGDVINLGERQEEGAAPPHSRCQSSTTLEGPIRVESQEQLDALEGCQVIAGDLDLVAWPSANVRSLHALTRVEGYVQIGGHTPVRRENDGLTTEEWLQQIGEYETSVSGWLTSLEGLERLEAADSLSITAPLTSLRPLSGLRRINSGVLAIGSDALASLAGLENVRGFESLGVRGSELRDISAISLPERMGALWIGAPVDALNASALKTAERIELEYTQLPDLDAFENLENVGVLSLVGNQQLRDIDGLDRVGTLGELMVLDNPVLERMGNFASLHALDSIQIERNDSLTELPRFPSYFESSESSTFADRPFIDVTSVVVRENASLRRLVMPAAWKVAAFVLIERTELETIEFANLRSVATLIVSMNPSLAEVNLGALSSVAYLEVTGNYALPLAAFDGVRSLESHIDERAPVP